MVGRQQVYIIAEAGVNHNGSLQLAKQLVDIAKQCGADAVKFQTFTAEDLVTKSAPKAQYQVENTQSAGSQFEMIKSLELNQNDFALLKAYCEDKKIQFLSTPFDVQSLIFLTQTLNMPMIKIASGEITNGPLLLAAAQTKKPIILSTGMSTLAEIEAALNILAYGYLNDVNPLAYKDFASSYESSLGKEILQEKVLLLHCTSEYPTKFHNANLRAIQTLNQRFGLCVGYSDHTLGIEASIAAVAMGAKIIEKHFTIDKNFTGPDHKASLTPDELGQLVASIRNIEQAFGDGLKKPVASELETLKIARRSLVAKSDIAAGEVFHEHNIVAKRPGTGISPMEYWDYIGKTAKRNYQKDDVIC